MANGETNVAWHRRAEGLTPAGVHSNARLVGADVVLASGDGPWLVDVEGHRHVDYMLGRGPAFLGHTPHAVNNAVAAAVASGLTLGSGTTLEVEAADLALSVIEWADQIRFTSSGTEAVQAAFRLARAATGRRLIVQFVGQYHGWFDSVSLVPGTDPFRGIPATAGQVPDSGANTLLLPWNDLGALNDAFAAHGDDIAAVITEPANIFAGVLANPGYLPAVREMTARRGAVLIFDEVVTGFRLRPGTSVPLFGVTPDLATYAKAMASGWPVSAVAGTAAMFAGVASDRVRLSGTYNGNSASMAAVIATVRATADGAVHAAVHEFGTALIDALVHAAARQNVPVRAVGFPSAFWLTFESVNDEASVDAAERLGVLLRRHRVIQYHHTWLPSAAHDAAALTFTVNAFEHALADLLAERPELRQV